MGSRHDPRHLVVIVGHGIEGERQSLVYPKSQGELLQVVALVVGETQSPLHGREVPAHLADSPGILFVLSSQTVQLSAGVVGVAPWVVVKVLTQCADDDVVLDGHPHSRQRDEQTFIDRALEVGQLSDHVGFTDVCVSVSTTPGPVPDDCAITSSCR